MNNYLESCKKDVEDIVNITHDFYRKCSSVSSHNNNNLVGLYFHEIIRYFSTIVVERGIVNHRVSNTNAFLNCKIRFGYRGKLSIYNADLKLNNKRKFISLFSKLPIFSNRPTLHLGDVSINNYKIIYHSYLKGYKVTYIDPNTTVFIEKYDSQYKIMMELVKKLCFDFNIEFNENFLNDIESSQSIVSKNLPSVSQFNDGDVVLIGTPAKVNNRISSINSYYYKVKVLGVLHSDAAGSDDAPSWRYDDRSNCTHLIGYGPYGDYLRAKEGSFLSLNVEGSSYIQSDSETCRKIYDETVGITRLFDYCKINKQKGLYISNRINNISVINPYPIMDPLDYVKWQKFILKKFPKVFVKKHPKQVYTVDYDNQVEQSDNLNEVVNNCDYDFFIVDGVASTSFSLIASTNKPIIFFNIEEHCLTDRAIKAIKKRVLWVDIDIFSSYEGFEQYKNMKIINKFENKYTPMFSLSENKASRVTALLSVL